MIRSAEFCGPRQCGRRPRQICVTFATRKYRVANGAPQKVPRNGGQWPHRDTGGDENLDGTGRRESPGPASAVVRCRETEDTTMNGGDMNTASHPIVVGVDGSETSMSAARWAAAVADRQKVPLHLAHALPNPGYYLSEAAVLIQADFAEQVHQAAEEILAQTKERVRRDLPELTVTQSIHPGPAAPVLLELGATAKMLVLGATGAGVVESLLLGSTVLRVANHARCPVTVWRGAGEQTLPDQRPVVVGVDGSELSESAVSHAFEYAALFDAPLRAVHAWNAGGIAGLQSAMLMVNWAAVGEEETALLSERLAGRTERYPDVEVTKVIEQDSPGRAP